MGWPPPVPQGTADFCFPFGLSVFFPAYNDAPSLPSLLARTMATLSRVATDYEVIVVNDGSKDDTAEILEELRQKYRPRLRIVTHAENRGYGAALQSGFAAASKEFVFYTDGDGQYDPAEIESLLRSVKPETGLVNGFKTKRNDPWHRIAIGWLHNHFARWIFGIRLRDIDCDFRLIRREVLCSSHLRSTGGTICVELVRSLERSGCEVVEVPVSHYPRCHGRSQFFRTASLANTFVQLVTLFVRTVMITPAGFSFSLRSAGLMLACVSALSFLAYGRALQLPFISDDYLQIQLGRDYGPFSRWPALAEDALYRCRATSVVLTYWTELVFGLDRLAFKVSSLFLHILSAFLVFTLGLWRQIGWKVAAVAACFFAISQRHSEAVVWYAALPELLVFLFSTAGFLCWVHWIQSRKHPIAAYAGALCFYVLALLSKESAVVVVPLCVLAVLCQPERPFRRLWGVVPFGMLAGFYFGMAYLARDTHLHFNDGTFSIGAPFWAVLIRSASRLLWIWGLAALILIQILKAWQWRGLVVIAGAWIALTLLPYSFLTYMPHVPSRHTYFASAGLSLIVAAGLITLQDWSRGRGWRWVVSLTAAVLVLHQSGYLWTYKHRQYALRAEPTEKLVRVGQESSGPIYAKCFPYSPQIGELALKQRVSASSAPALHTGPDAARRPNSIDFCNEVAY